MKAGPIPISHDHDPISREEKKKEQKHAKCPDPCNMLIMTNESR
jgi:hypothetical protein